MIDLYKSLPYAIAAYVVIAVVFTTYFGTLLWRTGKVQKEIEHLEGLAAQSDSKSDVSDENRSNSTDE